MERKPDEYHGGSYDTEYSIWAAMKHRCRNVNEHYHFGRGVSVCQRWVDSYAAFISDVGRRPSPNHTIDRFPDRNGNYEPGNVRWATHAEQQANLSNNIHVTVDGRKMLVTHACRYLGISRDSVRRLVKRYGVSQEEAIEKVLLNKRSTITGHGVDGRFVGFFAKEITDGRAST